MYSLYIYKQDLALNNLQGLICLRTQPAKKLMKFKLIPFISVIVYFNFKRAHCSKIFTSTIASIHINLVNKAISNPIIVWDFICTNHVHNNFSRELLIIENFPLFAMITYSVRVPSIDQIDLF